MDTSQPGAEQRFTWQSGAAYERFVGRWSRLVAPKFLDWLSPTAGLRWLDVGCGSGALCQAVLQAASPAALIGLDRSADFLTFTRQNIQDGRAHFSAGDGQALPLASEACDAVVSGLVLNFIPQPALAVEEMARVARPGGLVAAYVWDYAGEMQMLRHFWEAAAALEPAAYALDEGRRFPICHPEALAGVFQKADLQQVEVAPLEIETYFKDFDDYWSPFLGGQGPGPGYVMSLSEERRAALRERLRASLPYAPDGSLALVARAWAVVGAKHGGMKDGR